MELRLAHDGKPMIQLVPATTDTHFHEALTLIEEMAHWDAEESRRVGLDGEAVMGFFYLGKALDALRRECASPEGCLLLATAMDDAPAGCGAFRRIDGSTCELLHMYVRDEHRGKRIGRRVLEQLVQLATEAGYRSMVLETATFMSEAQKLYESLGFTRRPPYREIPEAFLPFTVCMELRLTAA